MFLNLIIQPLTIKKNKIMSSGCILCTCLITLFFFTLVLGIINCYSINRTFSVSRGMVGYLTDIDKKMLVNNNLYYYRKKSYKKRNDESENEMPIEGNSSFLTNCVTNDNKQLKMRIRYRYTFDLTHFFDTLKNTTYKSELFFDNYLKRYINDIVQYHMLQVNRKDLYNYKTFDKMYQDINDALPDYLLKKGIYMDIKVTNIQTYKE